VKLALATLALFGVTAIYGCGPTLDVSPVQVEAQFEAALNPGDSASAIEAYFATQGLEATYDKHSDRYQSIIRHPDSNFHAISIYVNVDEQQRFAGVEARDSYTWW